MFLQTTSPVFITVPALSINHSPPSISGIVRKNAVPESEHQSDTFSFSSDISLSFRVSIQIKSFSPKSEATMSSCSLVLGLILGKRF